MGEVEGALKMEKHTKMNSTVSAPVARLALWAAVATVAFLAILHVLSPEFDPSYRVVSEYALGHYRWVLSLMFLAWAISSWALAFVIRGELRTVMARTGLALLIVAGFGEALASIFDLNRPILHGIAGLLGVGGFPIAALLISISLSRRPCWSGNGKTLLWTASLTWLSLALLLTAMFTLTRKTGPRLPIGWPNRVLVAVYCLWVIVVAWQAITTAEKKRMTTIAKGV